MYDKISSIDSTLSSDDDGTTVWLSIFYQHLSFCCMFFYKSKLEFKLSFCIEQWCFRIVLEEKLVLRSEFILYWKSQIILVFFQTYLKYITVCFSNYRSSPFGGTLNSSFNKRPILAHFLRFLIAEYTTSYYSSHPGWW